MALTTRSTYKRFVGLIITFKVHRLSIFAFSNCLYQGPKASTPPMVVVAVHPLAKWLVTYTSYFQ